MGPQNWIVFFDAVGTLIYPEPDVGRVYFDIAKKFDSRLSTDEIRNRFSSARKLFFNADASTASDNPGDLVSSESIEREQWRELVHHVLDDIHPIDPAFDQLWSHFAAPRHWRVYSDVEPCLKKLAKRGARIHIGSNFDARLIPIVQSFPELSLCSHIFCSSEVGFRKPDPQFYERIASQIPADPDTRFAMVGDDIENDFHAPQQLGWQAIWLNRKAANGENGNSKPDGLPPRKKANSSVDEIGSLDEVELRLVGRWD